MNNNKCIICSKKTNDLRFGFCFDCATAESIISTGVDMFDKNINDENLETDNAREKLQFLIKKGWKKC